MQFETGGHRIRNRIAAVCATLLLAGVSGFSQSNGDGFLFKEPFGTVTIRAGIDRPGAASDVFSSITQRLTVNRRDFRGFHIAGDATLHIRGRLNAMVSAGYSQSSTESEFRAFVDNSNMPIEQTTTFIRVPVSLGAKFYLMEPGQSIGRTAWIPARFAPYAGGGAGAMWYRLRQEGDFVDFQTLAVFPDTFVSQGLAPMGMAFGGLDITVHPRAALTFEGRYTWARARLNRDFSGFEPIDLSGLAMTVGVSLRF